MSSLQEEEDIYDFSYLKNNSYLNNGFLDEFNYMEELTDTSGDDIVYSRSLKPFEKSLRPRTARRLEQLTPKLPPLPPTKNPQNNRTNIHHIPRESQSDQINKPLVNTAPAYPDIDPIQRPLVSAIIRSTVNVPPTIAGCQPLASPRPPKLSNQVSSLASFNTNSRPSWVDEREAKMQAASVRIYTNYISAVAGARATELEKHAPPEDHEEMRRRVLQRIKKEYVDEPRQFAEMQSTRLPHKEAEREMEAERRRLQEQSAAEEKERRPRRPKVAFPMRTRTNAPRTSLQPQLSPSFESPQTGQTQSATTLAQQLQPQAPADAGSGRCDPAPPSRPPTSDGYSKRKRRTKAAGKNAEGRRSPTPCGDPQHSPKPPKSAKGSRDERRHQNGQVNNHDDLGITGVKIVVGEVNHDVDMPTNPSVRDLATLSPVSPPLRVEPVTNRSAILPTRPAGFKSKLRRDEDVVITGSLAPPKKPLSLLGARNNGPFYASGNQQ